VRLAVALSLLALACTTPSPPIDAGTDAPPSAPLDAGNPVIVAPDVRAACADHDPLRRPFFGDLHVHTQLSFDAHLWGNRSSPRDAYRFARGEAVGIAPYDASGAPTRMAQLRRPLDFAAVTDHSEFLRETSLCTDPSSPGYASFTCQQYRNASAYPPGAWASALTSPHPLRPDACAGAADRATCEARLGTVWSEIQDAAEAAYDRTSACAFTTFVAYEWSAATGVNNLHRNVIFRNRSVPSAPISYIETPTPALLWTALAADCLDTGTPCDVLAIPHNSNLGGGGFFVPEDDAHVPYTAAEATQRARLEPLVEIYQHKGASECLAGVAGDPLSSEDALCGFESIARMVCTSPGVPAGCTNLCSVGGGSGFTGGCVEPRDFVRAGLRTGLSEWARVGVNPFELGFIASTDTHAAIPGATDEDQWPGHVADFDATAAQRLAPSGGVPVAVNTNGPGGLAVVWAEENSRDSLFDAMRRRETYATSGTRIVVRLFGGWSYPATMCSDPMLVANGYAGGVPMGGELPTRTGTTPRFVVSAMRDDLSAPLERIQIVKGWIDSSGATHEQVFDVAGGADGSTVDLTTCTATAHGSATLCDVWTDPSFDPAQPSFYYARVLEDPTCRWSHRLCLSEHVDCTTIAAGSPLAACCDGTLPDTIQERAWTSPIWYVPPRP
jgi:hypothetical protein